MDDLYCVGIHVWYENNKEVVTSHRARQAMSQRAGCAVGQARDGLPKWLRLVEGELLPPHTAEPQGRGGFPAPADVLEVDLCSHMLHMYTVVDRGRVERGLKETITGAILVECEPEFGGCCSRDGCERGENTCS